MLAPESGDEYYLIAVVNHDEAVRRLAKRRYTVNHALGILEVRDQEAIDTLTPAFTRAAQAAPQRLFDGHKDSVLVRLGIDAGLLPLIRGLTSEEQLDVLATLIPRRQYDALCGLASGLSEDEVWQELSQHVVDVPADVDPNDLAAAVERTPDQYRMVSGPDELAEILAKPFEAWLVYLNRRQHNLAYRDSYRGSALVTGGPGTGKTVTALHRAAFLAQRYREDEGPAPILLTTFSRNLAEALERQLTLLADERVRSKIDVINVDRLAYQLVSRYRGQQPQIADDRELAELWQKAATASGEFSSAFLEREWEQVILTQRLPDRLAYLACDRPGRGKQLRGAARGRAWPAISGVLEQLRQSGKQTLLQLAQEAADTLRERNTEGGEHLYRHVIVDEGQDLHPAHWEMLRAAVASGADDLFILSDPNQRIYNNRVSLERLGIPVRGRSHRLTISYRTTQEILNWATPILTGEPATGLDDEPDSLNGYRSDRQGNRPMVITFPDRAAETRGLVEKVRAWLAEGVEADAIGVATRTRQLAREKREALREAKIAAVGAGSKERGSVRVDTMHKMKGREFRNMAVVHVDDSLVPLPAAMTDVDEDPVSYEQDVLRERCLLFVACTRARDALYVSHVAGHGSRFLPNGAATVGGRG
ncbi:UvrD-helicase domain-containing protein [Amycolatopsis anabasis]|uniref:UvrD-helicase domain-containing protein n=1 Tax=Amycolatopsis anabasis TaxID=1840409 RepID=UPI001C554D16|nr:UvrD-helicase domain-containing protein [Amycolatopsis anabasis]